MKDLLYKVSGLYFPLNVSEDSTYCLLVKEENNRCMIKVILSNNILLEEPTYHIVNKVDLHKLSRGEQRQLKKLIEDKITGLFEKARQYKELANSL